MTNTTPTTRCSDPRDRARHTTLNDIPVRQRFLLKAGTRSHYLELASVHYRDAHPAVIDRVIRAVTMHPPHDTVGVVVIAYPTLACAARNHALPGRFDLHNDRSRNARRVNAHMRTISRLIVDPRYRGLGLGSTLVQAAVEQSSTRFTEAIASMARLHPVFQRAGMTPREARPTRDDQRLTQQLSDINILPSELCEPEQLITRLRTQHRTTDLARVQRAVKSWKRASPRTFKTRPNSTNAQHPFTRRALLDAMHEAAARLCFPPLYFLHDKRNDSTTPTRAAKDTP